MKYVYFVWIKINNPIFWLSLLFVFFYSLFIFDKPDWLLAGFPLFLFLSIYFILNTKEKYLFQIKKLKKENEDYKYWLGELPNDQDTDYLEDEIKNYFIDQKNKPEINLVEAMRLEQELEHDPNLI